MTKKRNLLYKYGEIDGPVWKDGCDHPKETYIASFECSRILEGSLVGMGKYDLYVYPSKDCDEDGNYHVCIRFGNEGSHYWSPTSIIEMTLFAHIIPEYMFAVRFIQHLGYVSFKKKE